MNTLQAQSYHKGMKTEKIKMKRKTKTNLIQIYFTYMPRCSKSLPCQKPEINNFTFYKKGLPIILSEDFRNTYI